MHILNISSCVSLTRTYYHIFTCTVFSSHSSLHFSFYAQCYKCIMLLFECIVNPLHFSPFLNLIFSLLLVDLKTKLLLKSPAINEIVSASLFRMRNQSCSTVYIVWRAQLEARLSFVNYSHGKIELATLSISFSMRNIMADYQKCYRFHTYEPKPQCQC